MLIDCDTCTMQDSEACDDCVVTYLLRRPAGAVVFDVAEERAIRRLAQVGLTADSRYHPRAG
jgi:hypothetical protein